MTSGRRAEAEEAVASFGQSIAELRSRTQAAQTALAEVTATVVSPDGLVTVTVDSSGALTDIVFGTVSNVDSATLARAVMRSVREARIRVLDDARAAVIAKVGTENPAVKVLAERAAALRAGDAAGPRPPTTSDPALTEDPNDSEDDNEDDNEDDGFTGRGN